MGLVAQAKLKLSNPTNLHGLQTHQKTQHVAVLGF